ncbi:unnamed protein product [Ectocarpus fasciculatus]
MTKRGRRVATGGPIGRPPKAAKGANAAVARSAKAARKQTTLEEEIEKRELEAIKQAREQGRCVGMAGDASSKLSPAALEFLEDSVESLRPKTGELTTPYQSRMILLLYFDLLKGGSSENKAKDQVAKTFRIGTDKVLAVRTLWYEKQELYQTTGKGRGKAASA